MYELNLETGSAIWSRELQHILGEDGDAATGSVEMALRLVHPDDRARVREEMNAALRQPDCYDLEYRLLVGQSEVKWVRDRGEVLTTPGGATEGPRRAVGVLIDITRRKNAERSLASSDALLTSLFTNSPVGIGAWDRNFRYIRVNKALARINGIAPADHIGKTPEELLPDLEGVHALYAGWRRILRTGKPWLDVDITGKTPADPDAIKFWRAHFFPIRTDDEITGIAVTVEDVTVEHHAETVLRDTARHLQRVLDGTVGFVGILDAESTLIEANAPALAGAGLQRSDVIGKKFWDTHWWSHDEGVRSRLKLDVAAVAEGQTVRRDVDVLMKDGKKITIDFQLSPVRDEKGDVTHLIPSGFDVTERNEALAHLQMLMEEVNHRSKNVLSLVQAIARQTVRATPEGFLTKFSARISALAKAQDLLVASNWSSINLETLIQSQLAYFKDSIGGRIHLAGPPIVLSSQAAQSLSLVLHELATNAGKYGALSNHHGRVDIEWSLETDESDQLMSLTWSETGGPIVKEPTRSGFGSLLIKTMVESTFDASSELSYRKEGVVWRLRRARIGKTCI